MNKIPTLFLRDPEDMKRLLPEVHPDCQWVLDGEGVPTRKYDGTCVMLDDEGHWWARREVKPGKQPPPGWVEVDDDDVTGKAVGWEPIEQTGYVKAHADALRQVNAVHEDTGDAEPRDWRPGTYELCGPKVNGNPEHYERHRLVRHDSAEVATWGYFRDGDRMDLGTVEIGVRVLAQDGWEGIVWHHPDGRMAKVKARDYGIMVTHRG